MQYITLGMGEKLPEIPIRCICKVDVRFFCSIREFLDGGCEDVTALLQMSQSLVLYLH